MIVGADPDTVFTHENPHFVRDKAQRVQATSNALGAKLEARACLLGYA